MSDINKSTQFMRGEVKWASILTPNTTFEPTYQASIYNPIVVNNFGEVINSDSDSIIASFEDRGFKHSVKTDKETNDVIPSDTPEDIWDLIQEQKKKK